MRSSRFIQVFAALAVLAIFFIRVRPPEDTPPASPAAHNGASSQSANTIQTTSPVEKITITMSVWGMPWEDNLFEAHYCREFERLHPEVRVKYLRLAGDLVSKYMLWHMRADGSGADVMRQHLAFFPRVVEAGVNEPLDSYVADPQTGISDMSDFAPQLVQGMTMNGHLYAIPADMNELGLLYNKDIFDAYNREHPKEPLSYPQGDWTWNQFEDAARKLTVRKGTHTEIFGLDFVRGSIEFLGFYLQAGGRIWNEDKTRTVIDSPEAREVIRFWKEMGGTVQIARPNAMRDVAMGPDKFFEFGKTAMLIDGSWRVPDIIKQAPGMRFGVAPLPGFRRHTTIAGSTCWALSPHSRDKKMAWELIKFLSSKEQSLIYWDKLWVAPPSRLSCVFSEQFKSTTGVKVSGVVLTPALLRPEFDEKAAWLLDGFRNDKQGRPGASLEWVGLYFETLAGRLQIALDRIFLPDSTYDPDEEIRQCVKDVNLQIEQQRKGLKQKP